MRNKRFYFVCILIVLEISESWALYEYKSSTHSSNQNVPTVHGQYSKVSMQQSRASAPYFSRSEPNLKSVKSEKLLYAKEEFENLILDATNNKRKTKTNDNFNGLQCPPMQTGQFVYIMDCRQFLNCWKGRGYIQSCSPGTLFNPETRECDYPANVKCLTSSNIETYRQLGNLKENNRNQKSSAYKVTPTGSHTTNHLEKPKCPPGYMGIIEHPTDCKKYLNCVNGGTFIQDCGPGTGFNPSLGVCDHMWNVNCNNTGRALIPSSTTPSTIQETEVEEIDVAGSSFQIDVRRGSSHNQDPKLTTQHYASNRQIPRPVYIRPTSSNAPISTTTSTTTEQSPFDAQQNLKFNREYYKPNVTPNPNQRPDNIAPLPISDALKLLLRPYLNGNDSSIDMKKIDKMLSTTTTTTTTTPRSSMQSRYNPSELEVLSLPPRNNLNQNQNRSAPYNLHSPYYHRHDHQSHSHSFHNQDRRRPEMQSRYSDTKWRPISVASTTVAPVQCPGRFDCGNGFCALLSLVCDGKNDCGNRADESDCNHIGYEVRLSNKNNVKHEGRVEVKVYNKWGYICDDNFGMENADVLCKELGFSLGAGAVRPNSYYPPNAAMTNGSNTIFIMDEVNCNGNESSLKECDFQGWGVHDCNSEEVVGVVCKIPVMTCPPDYWLCDTSMECIPTGFLCDNVHDCADESDESIAHCNAPLELRLVNGPTFTEGRVEIQYRGIWGTICDDDFGDKEARVVCQSLGYYGAAQVKKNIYGPGSGQIWLDQVACIGNETSLDNCLHWQWGEHNCGHTEDVGVQCSIAAPKKTAQRGNSRMLNLEFVEKSSKILPDQCGIVKVSATPPSNNRFKVVHGTDTQRGFHPWQAAIRAKKQGKSVHWCGAVLISRYHILTAAHCLVGYPKGAYIIRIGDYNTDTLESSELDVFIENIYIHEDFRKGQHMNNDVALILLKSPIRFNEYVQPICMPTKDQRYTAGMNCTISGWGSVLSGSSITSLDLRAGIVPIQSDRVCKQPNVYGDTITDGMFCAGTLDEGIDACDGDSGGPLVCTHNNVQTLFGIISWGQHCGFANKPGVYVKVSHYLEWIEQKLNHSMHHFGV